MSDYNCQHCPSFYNIYMDSPLFYLCINEAIPPTYFIFNLIFVLKHFIYYKFS